MYTPIATKSFGIDEETGLIKELHVVIQTNNTLNETIEVVYDIVLLSPTGKVVTILNRDSYIRYNGEVNKKFNALRESELGQGITALIENDLTMITSFETIKENLKQVD